jgi:hypothetical protein
MLRPVQVALRRASPLSQSRTNLGPNRQTESLPQAPDLRTALTCIWLRFTAGNVLKLFPWNRAATAVRYYAWLSAVMAVSESI